MALDSIGSASSNQIKLEGNPYFAQIKKVDKSTDQMQSNAPMVGDSISLGSQAQKKPSAQDTADSQNFISQELKNIRNGQ